MEYLFPMSHSALLEVEMPRRVFDIVNTNQLK